MRLRLLSPLLSIPALASAQTKSSVDWPVYGGGTDHTHYSTIDQITPANVARLQVAWTYATHDEFPGSEMQEVQLCKVSYLKPVEGCPVYTEYFKEGDDIPSRLCPIHQGSVKQQLRRTGRYLHHEAD